MCVVRQKCVHKQWREHAHTHTHTHSFVASKCMYIYKNTRCRQFPFVPQILSSKNNCRPVKTCTASIRPRSLIQWFCVSSLKLDKPAHVVCVCVCMSREEALTPIPRKPKSSPRKTPQTRCTNPHVSKNVCLPATMYV